MENERKTLHSEAEARLGRPTERADIIRGQVMMLLTLLILCLTALGITWLVTR